jgi:dTDP-4-amino-4,6-dideoxygalactose transaminase
MNTKRRRLAKRYDAGLKQVPELDLPVIAAGAEHVYQMYTVKLSRKIHRTRFLASLRAQGIGATVHFDPPVHQQPFYAPMARRQKAQLSVTDDVASRIMTLPMYPDMTEKQIDRVIDALKKTLKENRL